MPAAEMNVLLWHRWRDRLQGRHLRRGADFGSRHEGHAFTLSLRAQTLVLFEYGLRRDHLERLQFIVEPPDVADPEGNQVLADEVERGEFIPGGLDVLFDDQGLEAVALENEAILAVVGELPVGGRGADGLA